jgi:hypothetical protein
MERAIRQSRSVQIGPKVEEPMDEDLRLQLEALGYIQRQTGGDR